MISNREAIAAWSSVPQSAIDAYGEQGDFVKEHLINGHVLRMLGDLRGRRILDAGCGDGYLSRLLHRQGARVVGVEPAQALIDRARQIEGAQPQGITYLQADLSERPELGSAFDAVVCSMVLMAIPDWRPVMAACVEALVAGGTYIFSITHPAFEQLRPTWLEHGEYRTGGYLADYEIAGTYAPDFHRPISAYLNELVALGCCLTEFAEPGLDPAVAAQSGIPGIESHVDLPNFLVVASTRG